MQPAKRLHSKLYSFGTSIGCNYKTQTKIKKIVLTCYLFVAAINVLYAQNNKLDSVLNYYNAYKNFNGVVAIATKGKIKYTGTAGFANRSNDKLITKYSTFKIASVTKTFTAVIIMQLLEENKLQLNATIGKYLSQYKGEAKNKVTIYQLLTYSSGLPNCDGDSGMAVYKQKLSTDEFITKNCSGNLHFKPGSQFEYNNVDYILLGKIIENITGKTFEENLQRRILKPLHMLHTGLFTNNNIETNATPTYTYNDTTKRFAADEAYYASAFSAAGAMYATAEDMVKFDDGIFSYKLLKKTSVERMIKPDTALQNVGLGFWYTDGYGDLNTRFVFRPGGILGASANWIHLLNSNTAFIILSNTDATSLFEMTINLYRAYAKKEASLLK